MNHYKVCVKTKYFHEEFEVVADTMVGATNAAEAVLRATKENPDEWDIIKIELR